MKRKNLYTESGEPKRIRCYWSKTGDYCDPITVVLTYAGNIDEIYRHHALYVGLSTDGSHYFGSCPQYKFCPVGSKVGFNELPKSCQEVIRDVYKKVWEEEYFIMA